MQLKFYGNIQPTSRAGWKYIQSVIGQRQYEVYWLLLKAKRPVSNLEIATALNRPINAITPRTNELVKMGIVVDCGKIKTKLSPVPSMAWKVRGKEF
jgi:hypothetical protein